MGSEIVFFCDGPAHEDGNRPSARTRQFTLPDGETVECELCDPCDLELVQPLRDVLVKIGRKPDPRVARAPAGRAPTAGAVASPETAGQYRCFDRTCPASYASAQSLNRHFTRDHGAQRLTGVLPQKISTCPLCGESANGVAALGQHVAYQHRAGEGARSAYEAIWMASTSGDPYGVAADVIQWLNSHGAKIKGGR